MAEPTYSRTLKHTKVYRCSQFVSDVTNPEIVLDGSYEPSF